MWGYPMIIMFTITTLGGLGSIKGIMYATLMIGVLEVGVVTFIDPRIRAFVLLGVAVAILIYQAERHRRDTHRLTCDHVCLEKG